MLFLASLQVQAIVRLTHLPARPWPILALDPQGGQILMFNPNRSLLCALLKREQRSTNILLHTNLSAERSNTTIARVRHSMAILSLIDTTHICTMSMAVTMNIGVLITRHHHGTLLWHHRQKSLLNAEGMLLLPRSNHLRKERRYQRFLY